MGAPRPGWARLESRDFAAGRGCRPISGLKPDPLCLWAWGVWFKFPRACILASLRVPVEAVRGSLVYPRTAEARLGVGLHRWARRQPPKVRGPGRRTSRAGGRRRGGRLAATARQAARGGSAGARPARRRPKDDEDYARSSRPLCRGTRLRVVPSAVYEPERARRKVEGRRHARAQQVAGRRRPYPHLHGLGVRRHGDAEPRFFARRRGVVGRVNRRRRLRTCLRCAACPDRAAQGLPSSTSKYWMCVQSNELM